MRQRILEDIEFGTLVYLWLEEAPMSSVSTTLVTNPIRIPSRTL